MAAKLLMHDGVLLDYRCKFGSATSSKGCIAVARDRIMAHDVKHTSLQRGASGLARATAAREVGTGSCAFADIYLDDGFGITSMDGASLRGQQSGAQEENIELEIGQEAVEARLHAGLSWSETHLTIVSRTV